MMHLSTHGVKLELEDTASRVQNTNEIAMRGDARHTLPGGSACNHDKTMGSGSLRPGC